MTPLAFTKPCDLTRDADALTGAYAVVDAVPDALAGQHAIRRWEYAMAVYTIDAWKDARDATPLGQLEETVPLYLCDVGGAGSNFWKVLSRLTTDRVVLIDKRLPEASKYREALGELPPWPHPFSWDEDVETHAATHAHSQFDAITAISVIEHVKELRRFFRACHMLLKPGGLLFFTTDFWDAEGKDTAHFHWMRERIYNVERMKRLLMDCRELGFKSFGQADWTYPGNQLYDYSVASAAMVKK